MYRLFSSQIIIDNILALTLPFIKEKNNINSKILKQACRDYLLQLQPHCPYINDKELFYADPEVETNFASYFLHEEVELKNTKLIPLDKVLYPDAEKRKQALENSLLNLEKIDADFVNLFQLVMNTVFCTTTKRRGGTSVNPRFIGVMCAYHDMNAEEEAISELLIHEFTHQVLFLDELRYGHYDYTKMKNPAAHAEINYGGFNYKLSFHRCLHSLIIGAEILLARDAFIGHQPRITQHLISSEIIKRAKIYINSFKDNAYLPEIAYDRAQELFACCEEFYGEY